MYFEDMSIHVRWHIKTYMVGWLDRDHEFAKGETTHDFLKKLRELCLNPSAQTYGNHRCELDSCAGQQGGRITLGEGSEKCNIDHSETFVEHNGVFYHAPCMIYHYVTQHGYRPLGQFIEAVLASSGPLPDKGLVAEFWDGATIRSYLGPMPDTKEDVEDMVAIAEDCFKSGRNEDARLLVKRVLSTDPGNERMVALERKIEAADAKKSTPWWHFW